MEIAEGNKLIAKFMGGDYKEVNIGLDNSTMNRFYMPNCSLLDYIKDFEKDLEYHSSWDSIMPVIGRIERIKDFYAITVGIITNSCIISVNDKSGNSLFYNVCPKNKTSFSKIESVWWAVVSFIQWYNQQAK